jgi:hypothetical protein
MVKSLILIAWINQDIGPIMFPVAFSIIREKFLKALGKSG